MKLLACSGVLFLAFIFTYESGSMALSAALGGGSALFLALAIVFGRKKTDPAPAKEQ